MHENCCYRRNAKIPCHLPLSTLLAAAAAAMCIQNCLLAHTHTLVVAALLWMASVAKRYRFSLPFVTAAADEIARNS
jgi:hypothetical protein